MPLGPGAGEGEGEDVLRACLISSLVRGGAKRSRDRCPLGGTGSFSGKKWSRRALLIDTGSEAPRREGNLGVFLGATYCLAVHML